MIRKVVLSREVAVIYNNIYSCTITFKYSGFIHQSHLSKMWNSASFYNSLQTDRCEGREADSASRPQRKNAWKSACSVGRARCQIQTAISVGQAGVRSKQPLAVAGRSAEQGNICRMSRSGTETYTKNVDLMVQQILY